MKNEIHSTALIFNFNRVLWDITGGLFFCKAYFTPLTQSLYGYDALAKEGKSSNCECCKVFKSKFSSHYVPFFLCTRLCRRTYTRKL